jgi:hypothetical protein
LSLLGRESSRKGWGWGWWMMALTKRFKTAPRQSLILISVRCYYGVRWVALFSLHQYLLVPEPRLCCRNEMWFMDRECSINQSPQLVRYAVGRSSGQGWVWSGGVYRDMPFLRSPHGGSISELLTPRLVDLSVKKYDRR